jgi:hypothetical protein
MRLPGPKYRRLLPTERFRWRIFATGAGYQVTGKHLEQSNSIDGDAAGDKNRVTGMQFEEQIAIRLLFSVLICCQGENVTVLIVYIRTVRFSPFFFSIALANRTRETKQRTCTKCLLAFITAAVKQKSE